MAKVMVFGTFDGVHEGHRAMLEEAKTHGDYLIAVVSQDHIVEHLKGRLPSVNFADRFEKLETENKVDKVIVGDADLGSWHVVHEHQPDVIAVGYDQESLKEHLERDRNTFPKNPTIVTLRSFEPHKYKSSIVNGNA